MLESMKNHLNALDGEIEHMELSDHACTREYVALKKQRKILAKAIKKIERISRK